MKAVSSGQSLGWNVNSRIRPIATAAAKKKSVSEVVRGKSKARITRLTVNRPRKSVPMHRRDMAIRAKGLAQKMRPDGGDDRQQEGRIQENNLGIGHEENTLGRFLVAFFGDRRGHGLIAGWVGHADFLSIS